MKKLLMCSMLLLSGCSFVADYYEADPLFKEQSQLLNDDGEIDIDKLNSRISSATTVFTRNELMNDLLTISDSACAQHQTRIMAGLNTWNVTTGSLSNLLSAVGTVVGGESTKAALSAGATFTNGTRSLVNEEVYAKAIGTTIVRATMVAREKQLAKISLGMDSALEKYSVKQGLRDIYGYQNKCSFYYGLIEITKAIEQRKRSVSEIKDLISIYEEKLKEVGLLQEDRNKLKSKVSELYLELDGAPK